MLNQMFIARSGMSTYQKMMMTITNNIANTQTPGFKQSRMELETLFPIVLAEAQAALSEDEVDRSPLRVRRGADLGAGVQISAVSRDFKPGAFEVTKNPLDVAIQGSGFFRFRLDDSRIGYSRAGNLRRDKFGNITNQHGQLLDPPIQVPIETTNITIDLQGRVLVQVNNEIQSREVGQVLISRFRSEEELKPIGQNMFVPTSGSGDAMTEVPGQRSAGLIAQFTIENSNVDIVDQMVKMMMVQKNFDLLTKAAKAGSEIIKAGNA